ncbi:MAG: rhomboid family intramembrane serine protease [Actinobacteria bacterium]|nr:rhomboid family intramembrane serine protease [Actinomycetota bacterium]
MTSQPTVCYRHPDRVTRLACSQCGRPICAECSIDAAVGQKCPECAGPAQRTRVVRAASIAHADRRSTPLTLALIVINLVLFAITEFVPDAGSQILDRFAHSPFLVEQGEWWRGITAAFLHADLLHVGFNMWALWLFGPSLERRWGTAPFGALYLAAALMGSGLYQAIGGRAWAIGASGAIFGLFGALLLATYRRRHTPMGSAVFTQLLLLLGINLLLPLALPRIAWQAHVGGLVAGVVIAFAWERLHGPNPVLQRTIVALCVAGAGLALLILV